MTGIIADNVGRASGLVKAASGGDYVKLASATISSTATVVIDGYFSSTYENYELYLTNLIPTSTGTMYFRFNQGGSALTGSSYKGQYVKGQVSSSSSQVETGFLWNAAYAGFTNETSLDVTTRGLTAKMWLPQMAQTSPAVYPTAYVNGSTGNLTTLRHFNTYFVYEAGSGTACTGVTIYMSTGDIDAGNWSLYGVKI